MPNFIVNLPPWNVGSVVNKVLNSAKEAILNSNLSDIFDISHSIERFKNSVITPVKDVLEDSLSSISAYKPSYNRGSSAVSVSEAPVQPQTVDYLNADLAKHYGLGAETAYQEALSNTAYQRAVRDMKQAGLNPAVIFGAGKGYTAGGVSYIQNEQPDSSVAVGSASSEKLFSDGLYHGLSTAVGLATMATMKKGPIGFYIGQTAAKAVMGVLDELK